MKSLRCAFTVLFLFAGINAAYSLDVTLGVSAWYVWWSPSLENLFRGEDNPINTNFPGTGAAYNDRFESNPHLMAGPILNMKFSERWNLGFVILMSQEYTIESSYNVYRAAGPETYTARQDMTLRRYDGDLTVNYRIGSGFCLFGGLKYMRWDGTGTYHVDSDLGFTSHTESEILGQTFGPAMGLSFSLPLTGMLFFTASASGIYMKSNTEQTDITTIPSYGKKIIKESPYFIGYNSMAGFGYYISSLQSTLIIGGRYQYLKKEDSPRDLFYGITATVLYHF
ncbi:MAG TPA: hypothetical protein PKY31_08280 [Spirochaetota bacterium]|nr:hypothetical protein [Spirochaetota bacterium]